MARRITVVATAGLALALAIVPLAAAASPTAVTGAATSVGASSAVVGGKVGPGGEETSWYVEYGTTTAYGSRTGARSAGNGTAQVDVTEQLRGLTTGATYHYRVVATNDTGTARGADLTLTTQAAPAVGHEPGERPRPDLGDRCRDGRPERQLDGLVGGVRHEHELRVTDRHAVGRSGREPRRRVGQAVGPSRRAHVPLPRRRVERRRHDTRRRPELPHRLCAGRLDRGRRRHHRLVGTPDGIREPAGPRHGVVVRVRHDERARQPHRGPGRRVCEPGSERLGGGERPSARDEVFLPCRRAERRGHDGRADPLVHDDRRSARGHGCRPGLRGRSRADGHRRPGGSLDHLVVRAGADDLVRDDHGRQERRVGPGRRRGVGVGRRARAGRGIPRQACRAELRRDHERRGCDLPNRRRPRRRPSRRVRDLARACPNPRGRRDERARDPCLDRVRPAGDVRLAHRRRARPGQRREPQRLDRAHRARHPAPATPSASWRRTAPARRPARRDRSGQLPDPATSTAGVCGARSSGRTAPIGSWGRGGAT